MNTHLDQAALLLPIREISRLTGVNTVTLRAWERRYGLLKPQRTAKGHRLYTAEDVQRVKDIQAWLGRGLAISKVRDILAREAPDTVQPDTDDVWLDYVARIEQAVHRLHRSALVEVFNELVTLYPAELIADQVLTRVLESLQIQHEFGAATRLAFLRSVLLEHFYVSHYRQRQTARGRRILVVKLDPEEADILPLILNYSLLVNTYQAEYLGSLPPAELMFAAQQSGARGVVLYSDSVTSPNQLHRQLAEWQQLSDVPVFMAGKMTRLLAEGQAELHRLLLGDGLQLVLTRLLSTLPPDDGAFSASGDPQ